MTKNRALLRTIPLFPRLITICLILGLGAVGIGGVGYRGIDDVNRNLRDIYELRVKSLSELYELQLGQTNVVLGERALADIKVLADPAARGVESDRVESASIVVEESSKLYEGQRKDAAEEKLWREVQSRVHEWNRSQKHLLELIGKRLKAQQAPGGGRGALAELDRQVVQQARRTEELWGQCNRGLDRLIDVNVTSVGTLFRGSQKTAASILRQQVIIAAAILILALAMSFVIARSISRPLEALIRITRNIVQTGNLDQKVEVEGRDELAVLAMTFQEMVQKLQVIPTAAREVGGAVKDLTELIADQTASVQQQASGLTEATVTMQEIRETSSAAARKAETVIAVVKKAEEFSGVGQAAVKKSLEGLQEIRARIDQIMGKVADLSERTLLVGGIIESVKDLADQSNMLALNASIEAVKAGDAGKGFGVVAREIRSLADQSVQATARIREVLTEIGRAIRSTVTMAEQGKKEMEHSMDQIRSSGESLTEISDVVNESSQAARQIAASVTQQNVGIAQIAVAMEGLNAAMRRTTTGIQRAEDASAKLTSLAGRVSEALASPGVS